MDYRWLTVVGLSLDIIGAIFLAFKLIISDEEAIELGGAWLEDGDNPKNNFENPPVKDRVIQSRNAKAGITLLVLGFLLQLIGSWPR
jgi:hypothetical protein